MCSAGKDVVQRYEACGTQVRSLVEEVHGKWATDWSLRQCAGIGGVKVIRDSIAHEVLIGDVTFPCNAWVTRCGWRFGMSKHVQCGADEISCKKCLGLVQRCSRLEGECPGVAPLTGCSAAGQKDMHRQL